MHAKFPRNVALDESVDMWSINAVESVTTVEKDSPDTLRSDLDFESVDREERASSELIGLMSRG